MKQYCRYCCYCTLNEDSLWCAVRQTEMTEREAKRANDCNNFCFVEGDVFGGGKYKPKKEKPKPMKGQITVMEILENEL